MTDEARGATAAVVVVGSEILEDSRVDGNGPWIEAVLGTEGIRTVLRLVVGDDRGAIAGAIRTASGRAGIVVVSGGLGPTFDDLTREGASEALGRPVRRSAELEERLRERFRRRGLKPPESVFRMADLLHGAEALANRVGSAPGQLVAGPVCVVLLPGVPAEMETMMREEVLPRLRRRFALAPPLRAVFRISGLYESEVEARVAPAMGGWKGVRSTILASAGEVTLILRAGPDGEASLGSASAEVRAALGEAVFSESEEGIEAAVGRMLLAGGLTLAVAESCTAGMLGALITSVPGASAYFLGGVLAYSDGVKQSLLEVPAETLAAHGAVSAETALEMARGARRRFGSDLALAITGVAGPGGGTTEKPVGLVHIALEAPWGSTGRVLTLPGDRSIVRLRACRLALDLLRREILRRSGGTR